MSTRFTACGAPVVVVLGEVVVVLIVVVVAKVVVVLGAALPIAVATENSVRHVPPSIERAARTMGARGARLMPLEMDAITTAFGLKPTSDAKGAPWTGRVGGSEVTAIHIGMGPPLTRADIEEKFTLNAQHGGWDSAKAAAALKLASRLYDEPVELSALRG